MKYEGIDLWNGPSYLEHRDHKYIAKIGKGKNARYFYTQAEYQAYMNDARTYKGKDYSEDNPWNNRHTEIDKSRKMYVTGTNKFLGGQSKSGLRKTGATLEVHGGVIGGNPKGYDFRDTEVYTPHVSKNDKDPRWAINQSYKPKATKLEKAHQAVKNKKVKVKRKVSGGVDAAKKWLQGFFNR